MAKTIRVLNEDVLIRPFEASDRIGSLYVPDSVSTRKRSHQGILVSKGPNVTEELNIGDIVCFSGYTGDKISILGSGVFFVAHQTHIDAVLIDDSVALIDIETVKSIIENRIGELQMKYNSSWPDIPNALLNSMFRYLANDLCQRLDSWVISEGFESTI